MKIILVLLTSMILFSGCKDKHTESISYSNHEACVFNKKTRKKRTCFILDDVISVESDKTNTYIKLKDRTITADLSKDSIGNLKGMKKIQSILKAQAQKKLDERRD